MEQLIDGLKRILADHPARIIISKPQEKACEFKKIVITDKVKQYQVEKFTASQAFHQAIQPEALLDYLYGCLTNGFLQLNSFHGAFEYSLRITKKKKVLITRIKSDNKITPNEEHNRKKNYILEEGRIIEPLIDMGILTGEGKVIQSMYDKYRQINRFIEMIDDSIKNTGITEFTVIDFGCGKSYLTFLLYYYFQYVRNINVKMIGLDVKADVIDKCNLAARKYNYTNLTFQCGDIRTFNADFPVDMVISLHACDTATDHALLRAVLWNAKMIFAVPCCQHELNGQITSDQFQIITRYGILKEHISAALTDAVRANLLVCCGYGTQLLEFVDSEHTPKNILIRSVKSNIPISAKTKALAEVMRLKAEFHLDPTLLTLLNDKGMLKSFYDAAGLEQDMS